MGQQRRYISVILPLKLGWEPFYALPEGIRACIGDRVRVVFAGRLYLGVVSAVDVVPPDDTLLRIREVRETVEGKDRIFPTEIEFWRRMAEYYMCSVGEVFKAAYPPVKDRDVKSRKKETEFVPMADSLDVHGDDATLLDRLEKALDAGKTTLLDATEPERLLEALCLNHSGRNILWLVPEIRLGKAMLDRMTSVFGSRLAVWGSNLTPAQKRRVTGRVRSGEPYIVLGTRSALFLPHRDLGLIIVQDEHEISYKQTSPAPRYNGRDAALMLASVFGAGCVLESRTPSLESVFNCLSGKYLRIEGPGRPAPEYVIVDTRAEQRKNGMQGDIPRRLISMDNGHTAVYKPRRAVFPKLEDLAPQLEETFGDGSFLTDDLLDNPVPADTSLLAVFGIDALLGKQDFRADERALQIVRQAVNQCPAGLAKVCLQTREAGHPVFNCLASGDITPLLEERRSFGLPPFTRMLDVHLTDSIPERAARMERKLRPLLDKTGCVMPSSDGFRVTLQRGAGMLQRKRSLSAAVEALEKEEKYAGHIYFDVDPVQ